MRLLHKAQAFAAGLVLGIVPGYLQGSGTVDVAALVAASPLGRFLLEGATSVQAIIAAYGVWAFLAGSFLKGMMLFFLAPESVTPLYVLHAADSWLDVAVIAVAAAGVITAGNTIVYILFRLLGERLLGNRRIPFHRFLEVSLNQHARLSMFLTRLVPFIGGWATIPAGIVRVPFRTFLVYTFLGFLVYEGALAFLAYYGVKLGMLPQLAFLASLTGAG